MDEIQRAWTLVSYAGDFRTAKQTVHPEAITGTPAAALEAVQGLLTPLGRGSWAAAVSEGPEIAPEAGWGVFDVRERPDRQGWMFHDADGLKLWMQSKSDAVSYAMQRGTAAIRLVRIWHRDGTLRRIVLGAAV